MKITEVNTYLVRPRWGFVEIVTDDGYSGWGEAVLEGHASTVLECVREMRDYLLGADPTRIEDIFNVLYRAGFYRGGGVLRVQLQALIRLFGISKGNSAMFLFTNYWAGNSEIRLNVMAALS